MGICSISSQQESESKSEQSQQADIAHQACKRALESVEECEEHRLADQMHKAQ